MFVILLMYVISFNIGPYHTKSVKYMGICNNGSMCGWEIFHKVLVVEGGMAGEISHIYGMEKLTHNHLNWEVS